MDDLSRLCAEALDREVVVLIAAPSDHEIVSGGFGVSSLNFGELDYVDGGVYKVINGI